MPLAPKTMLGPYQILSPLGAGGMGEVYRARDPRMGRDVAIKVSAERFSDRFEREARAVAALNHPNICQIYDVGPNYLVLELIEGPTLADRIREGPLPPAEALAIARQIADALDSAHERGIVHRDLKPANVKVTPEGVVKVLDFGLARIVEPATAEDPAIAPTVTIEATRAGEVLGTAAYMAPETACGKPADKRADVWAFGVVLYEMLAGRRPFRGKTISDTLAAVLKEEPDWDPVPATARRLLQRCLEKEPKRRLRDIGDAWLLLEEAPAPTEIRGGAGRRVAAGVVALAAAIALWAVWSATRQPGPAGQPAVKMDLDLGADVDLGSSIGPSLALSPDGTLVAFVSQATDGTSGLFIRRLDQSRAQQLPGTEGAIQPFFSPDGQWVGFFAQGKLKKIRTDGGEPLSLCDAPGPRGASWGEDDRIVATLDSQVGLSLVPSEGGKAVPLTELAQGEISHRWPQVLPGGKTVLFTKGAGFGNFDGGDLAVVSIGDRRTRVVQAGMFGRYLAGYLLYVARGVLYAVRFDLNALRTQGPPVLLVNDLSSDSNFGSSQFDCSRSGVIAYRRGTAQGRSTIQWVDRTGRTEPLRAEPAFYLFPRLSPDGNRLLVRVTQGSSADLWIDDLLRDSRMRLTKGPTLNSMPEWSPDGRYVVFESAGGMFWARSDGAGQTQQLTRSARVQFPNAFSPDGTLLVFSELTSGAQASIQTMPVDIASGELRAGKPRLFLETQTLNTYARFSPDGRWLAYADAESGSYVVYVRPFPENGARVQISDTGGMMPVWSGNAHELFYRTEDQRIMVVNYTVNGRTFVADKPRVWFDKQLANTGLTPNFDLAPDGKRFAALMAAESPEPRETQSHVKIVVDFSDEVRRLLAAKGR